MPDGISVRFLSRALAGLLPRSLVARVYALTSLTLLLFVGAGLGLFYQFHFRNQIQDAQDSAVMMVEVVAQVVGESAVIGDYDTIRRILDSAIVRSPFASAAFIDLQGGRVASQARVQAAAAPGWLRRDVAEQLFEVNRTITVGGVDYGVVRLAFAVDQIASDLWHLLRVALALGAASVAGGLLLVWFPLHRWLGALGRVQSFERDQARGIDSGSELIDDVPLEFRPMFEVLSNTSNSLRKELAARANTLASLRRLLESMMPEDAGVPVPGSDDIEAVSHMISDLVIEREVGRLALDNQKFALDQHAIVSITDRKGRIAYANDRFCTISGFPREELIGSTHRLLKSGIQPPGFYRELWDTILAGKVWQGEICNRSRNGNFYWFASTIVPLAGPGGAPDQFISICTDITRRKEAEAELKLAKEAAEAANRAKSEFLANMSHEIRTPMNGIIGMTELTLGTALNDEQRDYLQTVKASADALLTIINDILDFSKIEAGKLGIESIPFDLPGAIEEMLRLLAPRAEQKSLRCTGEIGAEVPRRVRGDPVRLRQVLLNLLGNAIKFTERGDVTLTVAAKIGAGGTAELHFAIRDSGIGIAREHLEHIFEPFTQADGSTSRRYGGTGLGLSISRRLVELMGGRIWAESTPGAGSVFHVELDLPVVEATGDAALSPDGPAASSPAPPAPASAGIPLLLVEDNLVNQKLAVALLQKQGYRVTVAGDGQQALDALARDRFAAVLMDMQMPVMDGLEATRRIRADEAAAGLPRIPVIAMTANAMQGDRETCLAAGMDDYVSKPVSAAELYAKLAALAG